MGLCLYKSVFAGFFAVLLLIAGVAPPVAAADRGPMIGKAAPHPLTLKDQTGDLRDRENLTGRRGLIILFTRSFDW